MLKIFLIDGRIIKKIEKILFQYKEKVVYYISMGIFFKTIYIDMCKGTTTTKKAEIVL